MSLRSESKHLKGKGSKRKRHVDEGEWDCIHCTFKNDPVNGKCAVCDIPRGTSTRRGGYNPQLVAQQELEEMIAKDRAKQKRVKARNVRDMSLSPVPSNSSNPSTPLPGRRSPSPHLTDTSSMASPATPPQCGSRSAKSPSASTSRVSELSSYDFDDVDPIASSSGTSFPWKRKEKGKIKMSSSASTTPEKVVVGKKSRGRPKKRVDGASSPLSEKTNSSSTSPRQPRRSMFFTIVHDGVPLEFEEIIPSDVSDLEEGDESDDSSKSDES